MGCCFSSDSQKARNPNRPLLSSSSAGRYPTYQRQVTYQPQPTYRSAVQSQRNQSNFLGECNSMNQKSILSKLWKMEPQGQTKLRDAIMNACVQMRVLQKITEDMVDRSGGNADVNWRFVNVILTDGQDTSSTHSLKEVGVVLYGLDELLGNKCSTFLIGVGSDENEFGEIKQLAREIKSVSYVHVKDSNAIQEVFERIQVELGIVQQTTILGTGDMLIAAQQRGLAFNLKLNRFLVLFTIDRSGSMAGGKWKATCQGLASFLSHLTDHDLFGVQVFSSDVSWIDM